jgi:hypothetical protein
LGIVGQLQTELLVEGGLVQWISRDDRLGQIARALEYFDDFLLGDGFATWHRAQLALQSGAFLLGFVDPFGDLGGVGSSV